MTDPSAPAVRLDRPIRVTVVGAGVIGLSVAHDLARAGATVTVLADKTAQDSVSAVAGGLWFPYSVGIADAAKQILARSRTRFEALFAIPEASVWPREGTVVERGAASDRSWTDATLWSRPARPEELPHGADSGIRAALPLVDTPRYLHWLAATCAAMNIAQQPGTVHDVEDTIRFTDAEIVVVAAGVRSPSILGDDESAYPIRGQVVRLRNPGLRDWLLDDDSPAGMTYVLPRGDDVVCGGTADVGATDTTWDPEVEAAILERVTIAVPTLSGQDIVGRHVGLRPARPTVRLEAVSGYSTPVIACYGHGGAGITLSWGSAEQVTVLARTLVG